jgi:CRISPR/Cas system CSM-associated protein Csm3 (group 7 of RAMP superfamily)
MVHLRSWRNGQDRPVVSGTSLAGVIRQRALRIAKTLKGQAGEMLVDGMFGKRITSQEDEPSGSRVIVKETEVKHGIDDLVQNRVKIDRFTGGAYPQALFSQQPIFANEKEKTEVKVELELRQTVTIPDDIFNAEIGLLLLVLKDLWTGDLTIGGESNVGRGRLAGRWASLKLDEQSWVIRQAEGSRLEFEQGSPDKLESLFLTAWRAWRETK